MALSLGYGLLFGTVMTLQALGFKVKEAEKMLNIITDHSLSTEEIIRQALKNK
jgi:Holliday junction resolvasome RuvABC DNA-binding subunit